MKDVMRELLCSLERGENCLLVTLIDGSGSTPRGAGAQMLVGAAGRITGTVGGGAVEKRCEELALGLLREETSGMQHFSLNPADVGMVCGGEVTAHFQFVSASDGAWRALVGEALGFIARHERACLTLREDGGAPTLRAGDGGFCRENGTFTLPLEVGERVIVFGAGHVAQKLCPLLASVGFCPVVFDNRPELAREDLFPEAERVICGDFSRIAEYLTVTAEDYLVVMTNAHLNDMEVEDQLLRGAFAYLGVIGSKRKTLAVNEQLRVRGITDAQLATVHTPIGTPIGAVTPAELAVSITGEMIAVRAARRGEKKYSCPMH